MSYIKLFIDDTKPLIRPRACVVEEDWEHVCRVFPETGFRSYFLGYVVSKLSKELKRHGIKSYTDRDRFPEFTTVTGLLSNIKFNWKTVESDGGRGVGSGSEEGEDSEGIAPGFEGIAGWPTKEGKESAGETGPLYARLVELVEEIKRY